MSTTTDPVTAQSEVAKPAGQQVASRSAFGLFWSRFREDKVALFGAIVSEQRATLRCGVELVKLEGSSLVDSRGARHGSFDLIVISDGARSKLRDQLGVRTRAKGYPYGALWFVADDPERRFRDELFQIVKGTKRLFGLLPTGLGPGESATHKVSIFWSLRADELEGWRSAGLSPWKDEILSWAPQAEGALAQISKPEQVLFSTYQDVVMEQWHKANVVVLGDAAHAMSPQLGQGCNLALMDAQALADAVERSVDVPSALALYSESRREHLAWYQFATRWLTPLFQSDWPMVGALRDALMGWSCRVPFIGQQMVESMCEVSMGPLLPSLPLPTLHDDASGNGAAR
ncbi:MAG: FAD-dependent oxidoreductase [Myxococcaceae bacterium]